MKQYNVTGMSCAAYSARVEKAVKAVPGVEACAVSLLTNSMGVEGSADPAAVIAAVTAAGYGASEKGASGEKTAPSQAAEALADRETPRLKKRLFWSLGFLLVLMYFSMGHMMWGFPLPKWFDGNHIAMGLVQLLLAAVVMVINQRFFSSGFKALAHRAPNMDTLVALGSAASFVWSVYALFLMTRAQTDGDADAVMRYMEEFYFESAAMILTLITVGKMLEAKSKGRTTDALKSLMKLAPQTATVLRDGAERSVPVAELQKDEIFIVRPGEAVPVDGVVLEGSSAVNEAALTGESIPVDKAVGDTISAATVNQSGWLKARATRVGEDTTLNQIIKMVSDAAATKAPIAKAADKVSGIFVPAVISIAVLVTGIWLLAGREFSYALARGISVLVISCPCALGLATPVAIMVGSGVGAKNGILFKTAVSLEQTGKAKLVALDKTGTITTGQPTVTDVLPAEGVTERELLSAALALEQRSEHPLARAIVAHGGRDQGSGIRDQGSGIGDQGSGIKACRDGTLPSDTSEPAGAVIGRPQDAEAPIAAHSVRQLEIDDFRALPGNGLEAVLDGAPLIGGSVKFVTERLSVGASIARPPVLERAEALAAQGKTPLLFAHGSRLLGVIAVADPIKPEAPTAIRDLQNIGIKVIMLTGDNERTARAIAAQAGVDEVVAGVRPEGKEAVIRELQARGPVLMVGDGINDAPALTRADVGLAIGAGTDVAIDAADVVLMKSKLSDVPAAVRLSRATLRNIHENLFWAFIYNSIGIPLAAGAFVKAFGWTLNPMFGAAAMSLSSFCVVTNALRLNWVKLGIRDQGSGIKDQGSGIKDRGSGIKDQGSGIKDRGSGIRDQGSGIKDRGSGIKDRGSGIRGRRDGTLPSAASEPVAAHSVRPHDADPSLPLEGKVPPQGADEVVPRQGAASDEALRANDPTSSVSGLAGDARCHLPLQGKAEERAVVVKVKGMMCHNCERHVREALEALPGVESAEADFQTGLVTVHGSAAEAEIKAAIQAAGYKYRGKAN